MCDVLLLALSKSAKRETIVLVDMQVVGDVRVEN